jgi:polar amino acid transport system substrate-binding protein
MFARAAVDYRLDFVPFQRALYLAQGNPDSCILLVERRQDKESTYAWVGPLMISRVSLYALPDNPPRLSALSQLGETPVITHQGSAASEYLQGLGITVEQASREPLGWPMLQRGRAPLWATTPLVLRAVVGAGEPQPVEVLPVLTLMEHMACNPQMDQGVLDSLRNALKELYQQGAVHKLYQQYGVALD